MYIVESQRGILMSISYVSGTFNYITTLVEKLLKYQKLDGRNISMDRLYTSFKIADWLLQKHITMVGTFQLNRVGIPAELKQVHNRELLSTEVYWQDNGKTNLTSYVVKTSKGKKNAMILSTVEPILGVTRDDQKKKPSVFKLYDFTKGGTDIVDHKIGSYTVKSKARKWTKVVFFYLLDTVRVNANTVYALVKNEIPTKSNAFQFGMELAESLVMPCIRSRSKIGLQKSILTKIRIFTGEGEEDNAGDANNFQYGSTSEQRKRCSTCLDEMSGKDQKKKKDKLSKMTKCCQKCGNGICNKHTAIQLRKICASNLRM